MTDTVVDCIGRACPLPIIELAKAMKAVEVGEVITVLSDDPAAEADIGAWCRMRGQVLASADPPSYRVKRVS